MPWTAFAIGALVGLTVGWRAGRLHQHAHHSYHAWRGAVRAVPIAYRTATGAIKAAIGYVLAAALVAGIALVVIWQSGR